MAQKTFPCLYLCCKLTAVKLCWNGTFSMFLETAHGLVIIIELQVCIDPSVLTIPMNLLPQSVPEKLCSPRSPWYLWCPMTSACLNPSISHALVPLPIKNLRQMGWKRVHKILHQAVAAVHQYPNAQFLICTIGFRNKDRMRNLGISLFVCVWLLKIYSLDNGIVTTSSRKEVSLEK